MDLVRNNGNHTGHGNGNGSAVNVTHGQGAQQRAHASRPERVQVLAPPVDVYESEDAILLLADLPGVAADDVTIRLEKDELSLHARRKDAGDLEYRRAFAVPPDVDGDAIVADLANGVLKLTLPRKASAKPRQIPIRGA